MLCMNVNAFCMSVWNISLCGGGEGEGEGEGGSQTNRTGEICVGAGMGFMNE